MRCINAYRTTTSLLSPTIRRSAHAHVDHFYDDPSDALWRIGRAQHTALAADHILIHAGGRVDI